MPGRQRRPGPSQIFACHEAGNGVVNIAVSHANNFGNTASARFIASFSWWAKHRHSSFDLLRGILRQSQKVSTENDAMIAK
jgi:hypothetical protein